jgi:hypothetical protein
MKLKETRDQIRWLEENSPDDEEEQEQLIDAVTELKPHGAYSASRHGSTIRVSGWSGETLVLPSDRYRSALIAKVRAADVEDDLELAYRRNVENPRS